MHFLHALRTVHLLRHASISARATLIAAALVGGAVGPGDLDARLRPGDPEPVMGDPLRELSPAELERFQAGESAFRRVFTAEEGLGPVFTDVSCAECHVDAQAFDFGEETVLRFGRRAAAGRPYDALVQSGGPLLQDATIDARLCREVLPPDADVTARRSTPHPFGAGLVEAIPDDVLLALAASPPSPEVSGRANVHAPLEAPLVRRVGRFGWKSQIATIRTFTADAARNEMGITNELLPHDVAPNGDLEALERADRVPDPEDRGPPGERLLDRWTDYQRFLAPPPQWPPASTLIGERIFKLVGCAGCHVPSFVTGAAPEPFLRGRTIHPYGDFLLHDMGRLGDGIEEGAASGAEMRTAPLWGVAFKVRFLHDGRVTGGTFAENVGESIALHEGEAARARDRFLALSPASRAAVAEFLASLGRAAGDLDSDNDRDGADWYRMERAFTGPADRATPRRPFAWGASDLADGVVADTDLDGDVDLADFGRFQRTFTGEPDPR